MVIDEPDARDYHINLCLCAETLQPDDRSDITQPVKGLILVQAPRYPEYCYGDHLSVVGQLETPPVFEDFSYRDYLTRFGIHSVVCRPPSNVIVISGSNIVVVAGIFFLLAREFWVSVLPHR